MKPYILKLKLKSHCNAILRRVQNHKIKNRKPNFRCCLLLPLPQLPSSLLPPPSALRLAPTPLPRYGGWALAGNGLCCCCCWWRQRQLLYAIDLIARRNIHRIMYCNCHWTALWLLLRLEFGTGVNCCATTLYFYLSKGVSCQNRFTCFSPTHKCNCYFINNILDRCYDAAVRRKSHRLCTYKVGPIRMLRHSNQIINQNQSTSNYNIIHTLTTTQMHTYLYTETEHYKFAPGQWLEN